MELKRAFALDVNFVMTLLHINCWSLFVLFISVIITKGTWQINTLHNSMSAVHQTQHTQFYDFHFWQYLTSLLLPTSKGTIDTVHNVKIYVSIPLVIFLGAKSFLIFSFTPRPLYPRFPLNSTSCVLSIPLVCFEQEEILAGNRSKVFRCYNLYPFTTLTELSGSHC
jgi:hypothetical protein